MADAETGGPPYVTTEESGLTAHSVESSHMAGAETENPPFVTTEESGAADRAAAQPHPLTRRELRERGEHEGDHEQEAR